jgi:hypothetical protein
MKRRSVLSLSLLAAAGAAGLAGCGNGSGGGSGGATTIRLGDDVAEDNPQVAWILGALLDGIPALVVLIPLFLPLAQEAGMSDLHFAVLSLAVFGISLVTPPLGSARFIVSGLAKIRIVELVRPMLPFVAVMFATILLLAYVPAFSEWIPSLVG